MQSSIFNIIYDKYVPKGKTRLVEFFAGYGSTALGLKYIGVDFEHWKICEWNMNSIIAYASVHRNELPDYGDNFCGDLSKKQIAEQLYQMGVSLDSNKPATLEQLKRVKEDKLRLCFNSIMWGNNLVDITRVKGEELRIVDTDKYDYILSYSFPCQNLSLAGKKANLKSKDNINNDNIYDIENRSNMLWQVERILTECENKPNILIMENVPMIHSKDNLEFFNDFKLRLEKLGYESYSIDISATECGIPQTRNRCFMVSLLGDYVYDFPRPKKLKLRLKDVLEDNEKVDDKYFLSKKQIIDISQWNAIEKPLEKMEKIEKDGLSPTITTRTCEYTSSMILIKNATKKGYLVAEEGDGIDISSRMEYHRGTVQKGKAQTITTMGGENVGVVVKNKTEYKGTYDYAQSDTLRPTEKDRIHLGKEVSGTILSSGNHNGIIVELKRGYGVEVKKEKDDSDEIDFIGNYSKSNFNQTSIVGKNGLAPTVTENHGQVTAILSEQKIDDSPTIAAAFNPNYLVGLGVRKLTPRECGRLMGIKDADISLILENQTNSSAYILFGDSIVVNCLMAIYGELFNKNWEDYFKPKEWWKNE